MDDSWQWGRALGDALSGDFGERRPRAWVPDLAQPAQEGQGDSVSLRSHFLDDDHIDVWKLVYTPCMSRYTRFCVELIDLQCTIQASHCIRHVQDNGFFSSLQRFFWLENHKTGSVCSPLSGHT